MVGRILIVCLIVGAVMGSTLTAMAEEKTVKLNVSAASSLKEALGEVEAAFKSEGFRGGIVFNFGSSGALQNQIEQGIPCDLFISAAVKQMDDLEREGLLQKNSRKNLVNNRLVLIVPADSTLKISGFDDLAKDRVKKIAIGAPESVPAGQYAMQVLKYYSVWGKIQGKTVFGANVRAVLAYVETGNVDAGLVYKTDAMISEKAAVVATAPEESHEPILYPAAILTRADHPKAAAEFLTFLTGRKAGAIFEKYGFVPLK